MLKVSFSYVMLSVYNFFPQHMKYLNMMYIVRDVVRELYSVAVYSVECCFLRRFISPGCAASITGRILRWWFGSTTLSRSALSLILE